MAFTIPLTAAQFQNRVIVAGSFGGGTGPTGLGGAPRLLTPAGAAPAGRSDVHYALSPAAPPPGAPGGGGGGGGAPAIPTVSYTAKSAHAHTGGDIAGFGPPSPGTPGQAVYLPFLENNIASALLPTAGVDCFFTDALSGCAMYIDRVVATGQLVVYHANSMSHCPKGPAIMADPEIARSDSIAFYGAMTNMARLHNTAMGERGTALGAMQAAGHLQRTAYMRCVDDEMDRLRAAGNKKVDLMGAGTNVMGFLAGGVWEFWYQTWAIINYQSPAGVPVPLPNPPGRLLAAERFF